MKKILVVEDTEAVRESICAVLRNEGYEVVEAGDGLAALELLERDAIDLAVVDIWMPNMDGLTFLQKLRASDTDLPVIIASGGGPTSTLEHATTLADAHGADHVLFKPFEDFELLDAVKQQLGG